MTELVAQIEEARIDGPMTDAEGRLCAQYRFPETFIGFQGHFPGYPVLPAVIQIRTGQLLAEALHGGPLLLQSVDKGKFLQQIQPDQVIDAVCRKGSLGGKNAYEIRLTVDEKTASQFWLVPQDEEIS